VSAAPNAAACGAAPGALRVRVPEMTRILEVSYDDRDGAHAAQVVNCVASRAVEENRRVNAELAARSGGAVEEALKRTRAEIGAPGTDLARARRDARVELKRGELKSALEDLAQSSEEERAARVREAAARARKESLAGQASEDAARWRTEAAADEAA